MKNYLIAILFAIMSVACGTKPDTFNLKGNGWTDEKKALVQSAMDEWCEASAGKYCAEIGEGDSNIYLTSDTVAEKKSFGRSHKAPEGATNIEVFKDLESETEGVEDISLYRTMIHELGHHFRKSMGHLKGGSNGVMVSCDPNRLENLSVTDADLTGELAIANKCGVN